ncbi:MAG: flavin reductase family protein [Spirochaetales bacterium]|nr:flavin reductase family protein [Spirochaetales bacterium]
MHIEMAGLSANKVYYTFIQTIIPRPIAWVLSDNGDGTLNLAPFSYFNGVASDPPVVMLSIGKKPDGSLKDTRHNIIERKAFVIHIPHREWAEKVTASSLVLPHGDSELLRAGLATVEDRDFPLPRLKECRIAFYCRLFAVHEIGAVPQALILGQVEAIYLDDSVATLSDGRLSVDALKVDPLARLGGEDYGLLGQVITVKRPG